MDPRTYWNRYVKGHAGPKNVSERLGIPYQTIYSVCTGHRGIGHRLAQTMAAADPQLDASILTWVRPLRTPKPLKNTRHKRIAS